MKKFAIVGRISYPEDHPDIRDENGSLAYHLRESPYRIMEDMNNGEMIIVSEVVE